MKQENRYRKVGVSALNNDTQRIIQILFQNIRLCIQNQGANQSLIFFLFLLSILSFSKQHMHMRQDQLKDNKQNTAKSKNKLSLPSQSLSEEEESRLTYKAYALDTVYKKHSSEYMVQTKKNNYLQIQPSEGVFHRKDLNLLLHISSLSKKIQKQTVQNKQLSVIFVNRKLNDIIEKHNVGENKQLAQNEKEEDVQKTSGENKINQNRKNSSVFQRKDNQSKILLSGKSCKEYKIEGKNDQITTNLCLIEDQINKQSLQMVGKNRQSETTYVAKSRIQLNNNQSKQSLSLSKASKYTIKRKSLQQDSSFNFQQMYQNMVQNLHKSVIIEPKERRNSYSHLQKKSVIVSSQNFFNSNGMKLQNGRKSSTLTIKKKTENQEKDISKLLKITQASIDSPSNHEPKVTLKKQLTKTKKNSKFKNNKVWKCRIDNTLQDPLLYIQKVQIKKDQHSKGQFYSSPKESLKTNNIDFITPFDSKMSRNTSYYLASKQQNSRIKLSNLKFE